MVLTTPAIGRRLAIAAVVLSVALVGQVRPGEAEGTDPRLAEYRVKAALLINFAKFVQWSHAMPIVICTVGDVPGFEAAVATVTSVTVQPRLLEDGMLQCDVLFIAASVGRHTADLLDRIGSAPILSIGEIDPFINDGGVIRLYLEANRIRFQINAKAAEERGIKISSQLLNLAR